MYINCVTDIYAVRRKPNSCFIKKAPAYYRTFLAETDILIPLYSTFHNMQGFPDLC